jgi:L-asparaginase
MILKLFPGIEPTMVEAMLSVSGLKGVILETFGSGNAPTNQAFLDTIARAIARGIVIYNVTQCKSGAVEQGLYQTSLRLGQLGVVSGADITTEAALAKMMFLLGEGYSGEELAMLLTRPLRGEMSAEHL